MKASVLARAGLLTAATAILAYLDSLIPTPLPGIKLGLANVGVLLTFYILGGGTASVVSLLRVLIVTLITGFSAFPYSLAGAAAALAVTLLMGKDSDPRLTSVLGAAAHTVAQICVAVVILSEPRLFLTYLPLIGAAGVLCGFLTGTAVRCALPLISKI
ncbi:MAG: Gx transporter family protein [Eubacteriales bacterium]|nr:Gx transporter family protein [Eubacteriales bacterium]